MRCFQLAAILCASLALVSCGGSTPSSPSAPTRNAASTNTVTTATGVLRVAVAGIPPSLGASSQFTAIATLLDGSAQNVTSQATWASSDPAVATVSSAGVVTAKSAGTVAVAAAYSGAQGSLSFTVTSAATFTLKGTVTDIESRSPLTATVTARDATGVAKSAVTDSSGFYSIAGVASGTVVVTAEAPNYRTDTRSITLYGDTTFVFLLARLSVCPRIGFDNVGAQGAPFTTYTACGFTVTATTSNWTISTGYGHPAPFIQFTSDGGTTTSAEIMVTAGGGKFTFQSVDVYSSTTPIPYVITGIADSATVFTMQNMIGNTFGNFAVVSNPNPGVQVDTLVIRLTNPPPYISNPMGLDNIVVR